MKAYRLIALCLALASCAAVAAAQDGVALIAHRGGIVGEEFAENSPAAIEAAIERGYWMIEVDVRRTKDGRAILQHDSTFERFYGDPRSVSEMTWDEIRKLRAVPGDSRPLLFEEVVQRYGDKIRLMLDLKERAAPASFYAEIINALSADDVLQPTYALGGGSGPTGRLLVENGVQVSANLDALRKAVDRGEPVAERYFLFDLGSRINPEAVAFAKQHGVKPVAALNTFRYVQAGVDDQQGAADDAERLQSIGVRAFQIDSIYDRYFRR